MSQGLSKPITRADQLAAFNRKAATPAETMQTIFDHLANGGHLFDLLDMWGCAYNDMLHWIVTDDDRRNLYNSAMLTQTEFVKREVLDTLRKIARFDIRTLYDDKGALLHPKDWPKEAAWAVSGVDSQELFEWTGDKGDKARELVGYAKKVKLRDNLKAFEMIGKNLALFIERHEHTHKHTLEALVMASIETQPAAAPQRPIIIDANEKRNLPTETHTGFFDSRAEESAPTFPPQDLSNPDKDFEKNYEKSGIISGKISGENSEAPETDSCKNFPEKIEKVENENPEKISEKISENRGTKSGKNSDKDEFPI